MSQSIASLIKSKLFHGNNETFNSRIGNDELGKNDTTENTAIGSLPTFSKPFDSTENNVNEEAEIIQNMNKIDEESGKMSENDENENTLVHRKSDSRIGRFRNKVFDNRFRSKNSNTKNNYPTETQAKDKDKEKEKNNDIISVTEGSATPPQLYSGSSNKDNNILLRPTSYATSRTEINSFTESPRRLSLEKFPSKDTIPHINNDTPQSFSRVSTSSSLESLRTPGRAQTLLPSESQNKRRTSSSTFRLYKLSALRHLKSNDENIGLVSNGKEQQIVNCPKVYPGVTRRRSKTVDVYDALNQNRKNMRPFNIPSPPNRSRSNSLNKKELDSETSNLATLHFLKSHSKLASERSISSGATHQRQSSDFTNAHSHNNINPPAFSSNTTSTFSISRRSSSIVNALSSFVNPRSSCVSSNKQPIFQNFRTVQSTVKLCDLPTPPKPTDTDTCETYLKKLSGYGRFISVILTEKNDSFKLDCLEHFLMEQFEFQKDPLDISLRKLLIFLELPKEAQQIDRLLTEFAKVYFKKQMSYYCDSCPWINHDQVYFIVFSLLMLHTDYFNANNKKKMTKNEFVNLLHEDTYSYGDKIPIEILSYYYDNIIAKESPKYDFSEYYSVLNTSSRNSLEFKFPEESTETNVSSDGNSKSSLSPYDSSSSTDKPTLSKDAEFKQGNTQKEESANSSASSLLVYSPKEIIQQNVLFNSRRSSHYSSNIVEENENGAIDNFPQDVSVPPSVGKGRAASNSISSYFSSNNSHSLLNSSAASHITLSEITSSGSPFLGSYGIGSSSASFQVKDDIDIYSHIFKDDLFDMSMTMKTMKLIPTDFSSYNVEQKHNAENKYIKYYKILKEFKGAYLKLQKNYLNKLHIPRYDIENETEQPPSQLLRSKQKLYHIKIIRMGKIEELSNNNNWNPKIVLLTNCGILIYENNKAGHHHHSLIPNGSIFSDTTQLFTTQVHRDETREESYYTVNFRSGFEILYNNGMFAEIRNSDNLGREGKEKELILWGSHGKTIWRCQDETERDNWIDSINLIASLDGTIIDYHCLDNTIVSAKQGSITEKYDVLHIENQKIIEKFSQFEKTLVLFKQSIPLSFRTRNDLISDIKRLASKIQWLIREYRKNDLYSFIIQKLNSTEDNHYMDDSRGETSKSVISDDDEFEFTEESLQTCFTEANSSADISSRQIDENI